jgi:drug/metabolite transporter (DMT)-like permease
MKKYITESALIFTTIIWGGAFPAVKSALSYVSPMTFLSLRFCFALLLLLPFVKKVFSSVTKDLFTSGLLLGAFYFLGFAFQTVGLKYTTATKSGFITGTFVIFTPILQMIIEKRKPSKESMAGISLVIIGLVLLSSGASSTLDVFKEIGSNFNYGDFLTLICAIFYAFYIVYLDVVSKKFEFMPLVFFQVAVTAVGSVVVALLFSSINVESLNINFSAVLIFAILYTGLLSTILTTILQTRYQKYISPTKAGIIFSLEPIFSAVFAFFTLNEKISIFGGIGCLFIFGGLLVSEIFSLNSLESISSGEG